VLARSEKYCKGKIRRHKKLRQRALQVIMREQSWLPKRFLVVPNSSFAVIEMLWQPFRRKVGNSHLRSRYWRLGQVSPLRSSE
jgi:hypothetical protein